METKGNIIDRFLSSLNDPNIAAILQNLKLLKIQQGQSF